MLKNSTYLSKEEGKWYFKKEHEVVITKNKTQALLTKIFL